MLNPAEFTPTSCLCCSNLYSDRAQYLGCPDPIALSAPEKRCAKRTRWQWRPGRSKRGQCKLSSDTFGQTLMLHLISTWNWSAILIYEAPMYLVHVIYSFVDNFCEKSHFLHCKVLVVEVAADSIGFASTRHPQCHILCAKETCLGVEMRCIPSLRSVFIRVANWSNVGLKFEDLTESKLTFYYVFIFLHQQDLWF